MAVIYVGYTGPQFIHHSNNHSAYQHPTSLDTTIAENGRLDKFWSHLQNLNYLASTSQASD